MEIPTGINYKNSFFSASAQVSFTVNLNAALSIFGGGEVNLAIVDVGASFGAFFVFGATVSTTIGVNDFTFHADDVQSGLDNADAAISGTEARANQISGIMQRQIAALSNNQLLGDQVQAIVQDDAVQVEQVEADGDDILVAGDQQEAVAARNQVLANGVRARAVRNSLRGSSRKARASRTRAGANEVFLGATDSRTNLNTLSTVGMNTTRGTLVLL